MFPDATSAPTSSPAGSGSMASSYADIAHAILGSLTGTALLDAKLDVRGQTGTMRGAAVAHWLRQQAGYEQLDHVVKRLHGGDCIVVMPIRATNGLFLGAFCAQVVGSEAREPDEVARRLQPVNDSLRRELAAGSPRPPRRSREQALSERTHELEWLFKISQKIQGANDDAQVLKELLVSAAQRIHCAFAALLIPEKRLWIQHAASEPDSEKLRAAFDRNGHDLFDWVQRKNRPFVVNGGRESARSPCKILCVPVVLSTGRVIGLLAFLNPTHRASFEDKHVYLARHLGRQAASLIETQFDLMTGLYSRAGLEQAYLQALSGEPEAARCVLYFDIDRTHVANELHGFELGNELIVRIAGLMAAPLLPDNAICARISGDRFAVILTGEDAIAGAAHANKLRAAATKIAIGPEAGLEVSISCGVADLVDIPQGLARALAAAEIACKAAKDHGRDRVEIYAAQDSSIMRRQDDVAAVGRLRHALRTDSMVLFAQRIAPLQDKEHPGGYEILLRLKGPDGKLASPGPTIAAAQRYQLLPSIDRWVSQRAFEMLAPYRGMLRTSGLYMSINVSGQSLSDDAFAEQFTRGLRESGLPHGSVCVELTEQAAVSNAARAASILETFKLAGCRVALDDFGTGANTLAALKNLPVGCLKIDGMFVRDMLTNTKSSGAVRGIVELAKAYNMATVAEFVETDQIANALRKMGVDFAQGYAFGHPQPLDELLGVLGRDESARLHRMFLEEYG
jgi:diguanylate cyclase (GGDEF)-like protein